VPPSLLLDIKQLAGTETSTESQLRELFDTVAQSPQSPLKGRLSPSAAKPGFVSRVTFNTALKKPLEAGVLADMPQDQRVRLVVNYLSACDRIIRGAGAQRNDLTKGTILQAFFEVLNDVVELTLQRNARLRPDDLAETMRPFLAMDFDAYIGSNRPSRAKLVADLRANLLGRRIVTPEML
jgi:hypothetical protein